LKNIKDINKKNIMNSAEKRGDVDIDPTQDPQDNNIRPSQYKKIDETVKSQQPSGQ